MKQLKLKKYNFSLVVKIEKKTLAESKEELF